MKYAWIKQLGFVLAVLVLSTLLAFGFEQYQLRRENILLIYVASIILIMIQTHRLSVGIISTLVLVFIFNFFFTEPKYTFIIDDVNYIITLIIFGVVLIIIGSQTTALQHQITSSRNNAKKVAILYNFSSELLHLQVQKDIMQRLSDNMSSIGNRPFIILDCEEQTYGNLKMSPRDENIAKELMKNHVIGGAYEMMHSELSFKTFPLYSSSKTYGVLCIDCSMDNLSRDEHDLVQTLILLAVSSLDRESVATITHESKLEVEKERLKTILLRSISHDLRTPLTTLQTGLSFLMESMDSIPQDVLMEMINDLYNETNHLSDFVENILYLTRLQAGNRIIQSRNEYVDDLFQSVKERVKSRLGPHRLSLTLPDEDCIIKVDSSLIVQVIVNLIDNAIKHTQENSHIELSCQPLKQSIAFEVTDNGAGIPEKEIEYIFEDFTTMTRSKGDRSRGIGLGLFICRSIIEAHGGWIRATNNKKGGATFHFELPKHLES